MDVPWRTPGSGSPRALALRHRYRKSVHESLHGVPPNLTSDLRQGKVTMFEVLGKAPSNVERQRAEGHDPPDHADDLSYGGPEYRSSPGDAPEPKAKGRRHLVLDCLETHRDEKFQPAKGDHHLMGLVPILL